MAKMTFPFACSRLKNYFLPLGFEGSLESPTSMSVRVFDVKTGEDFAVLSGLPWSASATQEDLVTIVEAIEQEMEIRELVFESAAGKSAIED